MPKIKVKDLDKHGQKLYLEKMKKVSNMKALSPIEIGILKRKQIADLKLRELASKREVRNADKSNS